LHNKEGETNVGPVGVTGILIQLLGLFAAILLYRISKYGSFMHALPYLLLLGGALLIFGEPKISEPVLSSLILPIVTIIVHAAVVWDMRKDDPS
jgi:hypothetical protein